MAGAAAADQRASARRGDSPRAPRRRRAGVAAARLDRALTRYIAAQSLAVMRSLDLDPPVNPLGGAIALGHPAGATGAIALPP